MNNILLGVLIALTLLVVCLFAVYLISSHGSPTYGPWVNLSIENVELIAEEMDVTEHGFLGLQVSLEKPVDVNGTMVKKFRVDLERMGAFQLFFPLVHKDERYVLHELRLSPVSNSTEFRFIGHITVNRFTNEVSKDQNL